jgi:uncharacterized protein YqgC (DUF456 family)
MNWIEITALCVSSVFFLVGLAGAILPVIPANWIVWSGVLVHKFWLGEASVGWDVVAITGIITLVGQAGDLLLGLWGARRFGASWKGALGALLGAAIGLFLPPPLFWLIVGPILGAIAGELYAGRSWQDGSRAGLGTLIGGAIAFALKFGLSICVVGVFLMGLFF